MSETIKYQNRNEWNKIRTRGLGGSDAAAIMGFSPWRTPVDVWLEKTGQAEVEDASSLTLEVGQELEDFVARKYSDERGLAVRRFKMTLRDGILLGNIDRLIVPEGQKIASLQSQIRTNALLECKTAASDVWEEVPLYYQAQVQHYMGLHDGFDYADVACLFFLPFGGKDFRIYRVMRDQDAIDGMQEYMKEWWAEHVENRIPPEPRNETDCRKIWRRSRPETPIAATPEIIEHVRELIYVRAQKKIMESQEEGLKDIIASFMKDCDSLCDPDTGESILTYRSGKDRTATDWKALASACRDYMAEEIYDKYLNSYTEVKPGSRQMLVTPRYRKVVENEQ